MKKFLSNLTGSNKTKEERSSGSGYPGASSGYPGASSMASHRPPQQAMYNNMPPGQHYGSPQGQQYAPPQGQYAPPGYAPQNTQYRPPQGQQYAPPNYPPQGQQYAPPQGQYAPPGYPPPPGQGYMPPPGHPQQQPQQQQRDPHMIPQAPVYQPVSNPNAKRKALFIGINYFRTKSELRGCIADVRNVHDWLIANYGFKEICILTDDSKDPRGQPTRQNIINGMDWLVRGAQPGDAFFFHFSGHGSRVKDTDGDEADGWDETICPVDYDKAGMIVDDEIHARLVRPLPQGSRLTAVFDCCHSGSAMDLPYTYSVDGSQEVTFHDNSKAMVASGIKIGLALMTKHPLLAAMEAKNLFDMATQKKADPAAQEKTRMEKTSLAHVVQFSGCMDNQTSADAMIAGQATGAMSWALITSLNRKRDTTLTELLKDLRQLLYGKYQQIPQMSTSHLWNVNQDRFTLI